MSARKITNTGVLTIGTAGFFGSVVRTVLEWLGYVQTAEWLGRLLDIFPFPGLNWSAVWFIAFLFCSIFLVVYNIELVALVLLHVFRKPLFMSGADALSYVAYWTEFGRALRAPEKESESLAAIRSFAIEGKLKLKGKPAHALVIEPLSRRDLERGELRVIPSGSNERMLALFNRETSAMTFAGILANQEQVKKLWKNARPTERFLGWNTGED